jgi:hypothetical protein
VAGAASLLALLGGLAAPGGSLPARLVERSLVVAVIDAFLTIDERSRILMVNPAAERIFGYSTEEMVGREITMLMPERLRPSHLAAMARYLATGERRLDWKAVSARAATARLPAVGGGPRDPAAPLRRSHPKHVRHRLRRRRPGAGAATGALSGLVAHWKGRAGDALPSSVPRSEQNPGSQTCLLAVSLLISHRPRPPDRRSREAARRAQELRRAHPRAPYHGPSIPTQFTPTIW